MTFLVRLKAMFNKVRSKLKARPIRYKVNKNPRNNSYLNIVYLLYFEKNMKFGGHKVIYQQSEVINNLVPDRVGSAVLHVNTTSTQLDWFEHNVKFKKDHYFDPLRDFVVVPEIMVLSNARQLVEIGVSYAIFVQNGYLIDAYTKSYDDLALAYKNASLILAISEDTVNCILTAFPWAADKIIRIFNSIDITKFKPFETKENLITYMPRKLSRHADLIKFFLREHLPKGWLLKEVDGLNEMGVIELLGKSKIFLSFSEMEGLGLPPTEAALCGNYVVGYTGQGGKEYWTAPIFTEVQNGDFNNFVSEILKKIKVLEEHRADPNFETARVELANKYSQAAEKQSLLNFINQVERILNAKSTQT